MEIGGEGRGGGSIINVTLRFKSVHLVLLDWKAKMGDHIFRM